MTTLELDLTLIGVLVALLGGLVALMRTVIITPLDRKLEILRNEILAHVDKGGAEQVRMIIDVERASEARGRAILLWANSLHIALSKQDIDTPDPGMFRWDELQSMRKEEKK